MLKTYLFMYMCAGVSGNLVLRRISRQNVAGENSDWSWDLPHTSKNQHKAQMQLLQDEIYSLKERDNELRDGEEELSKLREENKNLLANLEDLNNQHEAAMEKLLSLKRELQKNFEVLKIEHEDLKSSNDEYLIQIKTFQEKLKEKNDTIHFLQSEKSDYDVLLHKYQNLDRIYGVLKENAEKFQEENQELHEENFRLQEQVTKLEHDLELIQKNVEHNTVPKKEYDKVLKELEKLKRSRMPEVEHSDEMNIDDNAKSVIENLKRELNEAKHKLHSMSDVCTNEKYIKIDILKDLYEKYAQDNQTENKQKYDVIYKLETALRSLNKIKQEKEHLEQSNLEKNLNINHLQNQIDDMAAENDFLTTDVQQYEKQLKDMKKNNDFLLSEITTLKNTTKLQPIIESSEDNIVKLESELADVNNLNKTFESQIETIKRELKEVNEEKLSLQSSLNDLKDKYAQMLRELEMCKSHSIVVDQIESTTNAHHDEKYRNALDELESLKKRLNISQANNEKLNIDLQILENDKILLIKQIDDLKHLLEDKIVDLENLESDKKERDIEISTLNKQIEDLHYNKTSLEENIKQLKTYNSDSTNINEITKENSTLKNSIKTLKSDMSLLEQTKDEFIKQIEELKSQNFASDQKIILLTKTNDEMNKMLEFYNTINSEYEKVKDENSKLLKSKDYLETQLTSTDGKISQLNETFNKLILDIQEKDNIIDELNKVILKHKQQIDELEQTAADLQTSVVIKNKEIKDLQATQHRDKQENKASNTENQEDSQQQLTELNNQIQVVEKAAEKYKEELENKNKEIKELKQSIIDLNDKLKCNENYKALKQDHESLSDEVSESKTLLVNKEIAIEELRLKCEQLEVTKQNQIHQLEQEKSELINLVNLKHNESIQYHNEIQRLNHVLLEQSNELKKIVNHKDELLNKINQATACETCENLRITLKEKDEIIKALNCNSVEFERLTSELHNSNETIRSLTEKCEELDKNLTIQLDNIRRLTVENAKLAEQDHNSSRELERLRQHLVETEESYTTELMNCEQKLNQCQQRLSQVEQRAQQSSTVYTSNSIRANQEVETLRNQIRLLEKQREDVQLKLSEAEDAKIRSEAALTNLQVVLEQFTSDKERDIEAATEKIRNKMADIEKQNGALKQEIMRLNEKLEESLQGLQAATRLGDQLETKAAMINDLKEQVKALQSTAAAAEERYYNAVTNQQDRVDKNLVKNLVLNYVQTQGQSLSNRTQMLRVLSSVLDFNQQECEKIGLIKASSNQDSLAQEFVKFLEKESRPSAPLPNLMNIAQGSSRSTTPTSRRSSGLGPQPNPYDNSHKRTPSMGSNNLLFQPIEPAMEAVLQPNLADVRSNESAILKNALNNT